MPAVAQVTVGTGCPAHVIGRFAALPQPQLMSKWNLDRPGEQKVDFLLERTRQTSMQKTTQGAPVCRLHLIGPFAMTDSEGTTLNPKSQKSRAVLAMLALSPRGSRSRVWMRDKLWSDRSEDQASASLRQALLDIRKSLGPSLRDVLSADKHTVSLDMSRVWIDVHEILERGVTGLEGHGLGDRTASDDLLEGIDVRDPEFEEWLMMERQVWQRHLDDAELQREAPADQQDQKSESGRRLVPLTIQAAPNEPGKSQRIDGASPPSAPPGSQNRDTDDWAVALLPPLCLGASKGAGFLHNYVSDVLATSLLESGDVRVSDLSMEGGGNVATPVGTLIEPSLMDAIPIAAQTRMVVDESAVQVAIVLMRTADRSLQWRGTCRMDLRTVEGGDRSGVHGLINNAVDEVGRYFLQLNQSEGTQGEMKIVSAVNAMFRLSRGDLDRAEANLRHLLRLRPSSQACAWLAFLNTFRVGQRFAAEDAPLIEEAQHYARRALELDHNNSTTLALVGHVHSFLFGEYDFAAGLFERSIRINPAQTLGWDLYAMLHAYVGQPSTAHAMAKWARELGAHSIHRYYFDTTKAISASLAGDHQAAIAAGEAALRERPDFNSILRFLVSSHAHMGNMEAARELLRRLEAVEPDFSIEGLYDSRYPTLQTSGGKDFIAGLLKAGVRRR